MPKLLRLTTTTEDATFDNRLDSDLILNRNSRIALQNMSMEVIKNVININNSNNLIKYSLKPGIEYQAIIPNLNYNQNNATDLLNNIALVMNKGINTYNGKEIGCKYYCNEGQDGKINIGYKITPFTTIDKFQVQKNNNVAITTGANGLIVRNGGTVGNLDSYITTDKAVLLKGCTGFRIKLANITDSNGVLLALLSTPDTNATPSIANTLNGMRVFYDGSNYKLEYIVNGVVNQYANNVGKNYYLEFAIYNGVIHYNIYNNSGNLVNTIIEVNYDYITNLYPFIFIVGSNTNSVSTTAVRISLEAETLSLDSDYFNTEDLGLEAVPTSNKAETLNNYINFGTYELANFLGFNDIVRPSIKVTELNLIADEKFQPTDISDSFLVLLDTLQLESFDGYNNKRQSILAVVPKSDNNDLGEVIYEPNYPTFIDLNNEYPINLRNIRARIVRNDYAKINTNGLATLTLLIDTK